MKNTYVVLEPLSGLYLTAYNASRPQDSLFGNLENAIEYNTQGEADTAAAAIGGGTVGTPKP